MPTRRHLLVFTGGTLATSLAGWLTNSDLAPTGGTDDDHSSDSTDEEDNGGATDTGDEHDHESSHKLGHPETQIDVRMESDGDSNHFVAHHNC
jgi:hypothetical protein